MKANIKLTIFDFDGTIADTKKTIVEAKRKTSILLGLEPVSDEEYASTIGMSSDAGFKKNYPHISDELAEKCKYEYVTYGNSDRDKLRAAGADYVIDNIGELTNII